MLHAEVVHGHGEIRADVVSGPGDRQALLAGSPEHTADCVPYVATFPCLMDRLGTNARGAEATYPATSLARATIVLDHA